MSKQRIVFTSQHSLLDILGEISLLSLEAPAVILDIEECSEAHAYFHLQEIISKIGRRKVYISGRSEFLKRRCEILGGKWIARNEDLDFEEHFAKTHILSHNFTATEYFFYEIRRGFSRLLYWLQKRSNTQKPLKFSSESHVFLLIAGLFTSITLLIFVFYFAVSKTYITIHPEYKIKTMTRNIVFAPKSEQSVLQQKILVDMRKIETISTIELKFNVTTLDESSARKSFGTIEILNELNQEQILKPNTRFVSDQGIVFRSVDWVRVPKTKVLSGVTNIGRISAQVYSEIYDIQGNVVGARGNIPEGTILSIPGLKFNRERLYARSISQFKGGEEPKMTVITQKELDSFRSIIQQKLQIQAREDILRQITDQNNRLGEQYALVPIADSIIFGSGEIVSVGNLKVGSPATTITIQGKMHSQALVFDEKATLFYMNGILSETLLYGTEKLIRSNNDSLRFSSVMQRSWQPLSLRATVELDSVITYDFENNANNLTRKLKSQIAGSDEQEIRKILQNDANISKVQVKFSPFWLTKASSNIDNIEFILEKGE